jgi:hypothetical protein
MPRAGSDSLPTLTRTSTARRRRQLDDRKGLEVDSGHTIDSQQWQDCRQYNARFRGEGLTGLAEPRMALRRMIGALVATGRASESLRRQDKKILFTKAIASLPTYLVCVCVCVCPSILTSTTLHSILCRLHKTRQHVYRTSSYQHRLVQDRCRKGYDRSQGRPNCSHWP